MKKKDLGVLSLKKAGKDKMEDLILQNLPPSLEKALNKVRNEKDQHRKEKAERRRKRFQRGNS